MIKEQRNRFWRWCIAMIGTLICSASCAAVPTKGLQIETFATVGDIERYFNTEAGRVNAATMMRRMEITKIYLDLLRSGRLTDWDLVRECHGFFSDQGFEVSAGITTAAGHGWGVLAPSGECFCYTHEKTQMDLEILCGKAAELFDEIIVDDFLMTFCTCPLCDQARAGRTWEEYRSALMAHIGRTRMVRAAHAKNPSCRVIIKYPQWYDKFHEFGYNPEVEGKDFDAVCVGTETRNPETRRFGYVQPFEGFFNFSWIAGFHPEKTGGAWYDQLDITPAVFAEQGYQSVLAGARQLTLFHLGGLLNEDELQKTFVASLPNLRRLAALRAGRDPRGIYAYKPLASYGDAGEFYIFDYLGMLGLPLVPCHTFPDRLSTVFLSSHALKDPDLIDKMEKHFRAGGSIIATPALLEALSQEREVRARFGYEDPPISRVKYEGNDIVVEGRAIRAERPIAISYAPHPSPGTDVPVHLKHIDMDVPLFTERETPEGGRAMVLNLSTFSQPDFDAIGERFLAPKPVSFLDLPSEAVNRIRVGIAHREPILQNAPAKVGCYVLGDDVVVVENFRDETITVRLELEGKWNETIHGLRVEPIHKKGLEVTIPARDIIALQRVGS